MFYLLKRNIPDMQTTNKSFLVIITVLVSFIAVGYSALSQSLLIGGDVVYHIPTSEDVIKSLNTLGETIAEDDPDGNLRFIGASPNNYVYFNREKWRIVGVFDNRLKIVRDSIGEYLWDTSIENGGWGINEWSQADIMKLLNPGYESTSSLKCNSSITSSSAGPWGSNLCGTNSSGDFVSGLVNNSLWWNAASGTCYKHVALQTKSCDFSTTGLKMNVYKDMIDTVTWYLGTNSAIGADNEDLWDGRYTAVYAYNAERSNNTGKQCTSAAYCTDEVTRTVTWQGKVGLLYPSDYIYATGGGTTYDRDTCLGVTAGHTNDGTIPNWEFNYPDCISNNWLSSSSIMWFITPAAYPEEAISVFNLTYSTASTIYTSGTVGNYDIRPTVYLRQDVILDSEHGDGSFNNPFVLTIDGEIADPYTIGDAWEYDYTGTEQTFVVPQDGFYKLEVWGAQGGSSAAQSIEGGYGGYSVGEIELFQDQTLYVNVGGVGTDGTSGTTIAGGYNGGGSAYYASNGRGSGGGASSISTSSGTLYNLGQNNNQGNVIIAAGGGGGYGYYSSTQYGAGGNGGGIQGNDGENNYSGDFGAYVAAYGGTQLAGGAGVVSGTFGKGADAILTHEGNSWGGAGGGGGFYGGGAAHNNSGGGGGSGYIGNSSLYNKHMACYNCTTSNDVDTKTISSTDVYSRPEPDASKIGNGFVRVTFLEGFDTSIIYTLTYDNNGGTGCSSATTTYAQKWGTLCTPEKEDYVFKEWNTKADGTGTTITSNTRAYSDLTVHAIWLQIHIITYNNNGGSGCTSDQQAQGMPWGNLCSPSLTGYSFEGWNTAQDGVWNYYHV